MISIDRFEDVVAATLQSMPANATHWSRAKAAERTGLSTSTLGRIWKTIELTPHGADGFTSSSDPLFTERVYDVVGFFPNPPESAVLDAADGTVISGVIGPWTRGIRPCSLSGSSASCGRPSSTATT